MVPKEIGRKGVKLINLIQYRDKWQILANVVKNSGIQQIPEIS
jgi:hypothetical protein